MHMNSIRATLMAELGLAESDFVRIPAFFEFPVPPPPADPDYSEAFSLLPNLVNLVVVNGRLIVAQPFYDGFKTEYISRVSAIGYQEGTSVRFIDDWEVYHERKGEVHCGTHVKRITPRVDWWSQDVE